MADETVTITPRAKTRIAAIIADEQPGTKLRVSVEGGGCSGFQYRFDLTRDDRDDDLRIDAQGALVLIDPVSLELLAGSEIDFVDDLMGASIRVNNPNATSSCGCGTSFSI